MTRTQRIDFIKALLAVFYACPKHIRQQIAAPRSQLYAAFGITDSQADDGRRRTPGLGAVYCDTEWTITHVERTAWRTIAHVLTGPIRRSCASHLDLVQSTMGCGEPLDGGTKTMRRRYQVAVRGQGAILCHLYDAAAACRVKPTTLAWHLSRRGSFSTTCETGTGTDIVTVTLAHAAPT